MRHAVGEVAPVDDPSATFEVPRADLRPAEEIRIATENYLDPLLKRNGQDTFNFPTYLFNSVFVTVMATLITLLMLRTKRFWDCVVAHMVTNAILGIYIVWAQDWRLW